MTEDEKQAYVDSKAFEEAIYEAMLIEIKRRSTEELSEEMMTAYAKSKERIKNSSEEDKKESFVLSALNAFMAAPENTEVSRVALGDILNIEDIDALTERCHALKAAMVLRFGTIQNAFIGNQIGQEKLLQHCGSLALFTSNLNVLLKTDENVKNALNFL